MGAELTTAKAGNRRVLGGVKVKGWGVVRHRMAKGEEKGKRKD